MLIDGFVCVDHPSQMCFCFDFVSLVFSLVEGGRLFYYMSVFVICIFWLLFFLFRLFNILVFCCCCFAWLMEGGRDMKMTHFVEGQAMQ